MEQIITNLEEIKQKNLFRNFTTLSSSQSPYVKINKQKILLLSSNNYLGLCNDYRLKKASIKAINRFGVGSGGSRLTTGNYDLHIKLEEEIANLKHTESSLIFNTGYMANLGTISSLTDKSWVIFSDQLNHASIIDGCKLSNAKIVTYKHCNMKDLDFKIKQFGGKSNLIVTDGVFSMDGDIAPLPDLVNISQKYNALLMVDDAHATGVIGPNGAGTSDFFGLEGKVDIQMGTLSKALASEGGFIAGKKLIIDYLKNKARSFIFTTALAPSTIAIALAALSIVKTEPKRRKKLLDNANWLKTELKSIGLEILDTETPIIPILVGNTEKAIQFSKELFKEGIFIPAIRPPTVPINSSRLRLTIMATHTKEDLNYALKIIERVGKRLEII